MKEQKTINQYILIMIHWDVDKCIPLVIMEATFTNPQASS